MSGSFRVHGVPANGLRSAGTRDRLGLRPTSPVARLTSVICERNDPDFVVANIVDDAVGKYAHQEAAPVISLERTEFGVHA